MTIKIEVLKENYEALKFPDKCHICSKPSPDSIASAKTRGGTNVPLREKAGKTWQVDIPVCKGCKNKIWISRTIAAFMFLFSIAVLVAIFFLVNAIFANLSTGINITLILVLLILNNILLPKIYTAPFDFEPFSDRLIFYYKDDEMGKEFARLNGIKEITDHLNQPIELPDNNQQT